MKLTPRLFCFVVAIVIGASIARAAETRLQIPLNGSWRFLAGDEPKASEPSFDDASWTAVGLPHTWNNLDGEDGGANYRRGAGWYRRHVTLDPAIAHKQLYLQFDGASLMAEVWVNGRHVGVHKGGMSRFRFDVTGLLKAGFDNLIAVRVDNSAGLGFPPTSADFTFYGGLYRSVWLLATDPVQISTTDFASPGVYVTQRRVYPNAADLDVLAKVENHEIKAHAVSVRMSVIDAQGGVVKTVAQNVQLAAGERTDVRQTLSLANPHLWNGRADPYLYTFRVELLDGGSVRDSIDQPLGLRFFSVDPNKGFFLNGHYLDLHGVNRHQDRIDKGWAISADDEAEDFALIKELGATGIRISHYEQADTWYGRCDATGIVAWAEFPFVNLGLDTPEFLANAEQQLTELIRQNFNHPAICFWGVGNETRGDPSYPIIADLAALARREDPSRLSTYAQNAKASDAKTFHTDVVAFNKYFGWYNGKTGDFATFVDETHAAYPDLRFGMSEFGAGASIFQHEDPPKQPATKGPFHPEEYQAQLHETTWLAMKTRPWIWGKFIWCMFDFGSDGRSEGDHPGINDKGLVTYDRKTRKDAFYWYKANWSEEPVVYITGRRMTDRKAGAMTIKVYSNAAQVSVSLNGKTLEPVSDPAGNHLFLWPSAILAPGENSVIATALIGGQTVTDACKWTVRP